MLFRFLAVALVACCLSTLCACYDIGRTMGEWDRSLREAASEMNQGYDDGRMASQGGDHEGDQPSRGGEGVTITPALDGSGRDN